MIRVEVSIEINRSTEDVFAYISNFENNPKWQQGIKQAYYTSQQGHGIGATYAQVATFMGRTIKSNFKVIEYVSNSHVTIESVGGVLPLKITRRVEAKNGNTLVSAVIEGRPKGIFGLTSTIFRRLVRKQIEADYANLKAILEADRRARP